MIVAKLKLDEGSALDFTMQVFGTTDQVTNTRFIIEGTEFDVICKTTTTNEGIEVTIPKLKGILNPGVHKTRLEVVVDDKLFTPLSEEIEFLPFVEISSAITKKNTIKEGVKVSVRTNFEDSKPREITAKDEFAILVEEAKKSGFVVENLNDLQLLKKGSRYYGLISNGKIISTKIGYDNLAKLIEVLEK